MIKSAANKQIGSAPNSKEISERNSYIIEKAKQGFSPTEIMLLLEREGFRPISRARVYQIFDQHKVSWRAK